MEPQWTWFLDALTQTSVAHLLSHSSHLGNHTSLQKMDKLHKLQHTTMTTKSWTACKPCFSLNICLSLVGENNSQYNTVWPCFGSSLSEIYVTRIPVWAKASVIRVHTKSLGIRMASRYLSSVLCIIYQQYCLIMNKITIATYRHKGGSFEYIYTYIY